jgi:hypothetical protein
MPSSYQVVLWKQESFVVLRPLQIEFFRNLLGGFEWNGDFSPVGTDWPHLHTSMGQSDVNQR